MEKHAEVGLDNKKGCMMTRTQHMNQWTLFVRLNLDGLNITRQDRRWWIEIFPEYTPWIVWYQPKGAPSDAYYPD